MKEKLVKADLMHSLTVLCLLGLAIRIAIIFVFSDYTAPLTAEYGLVAQNLAAGKGFVGGGWLGPEAPTALNPPVYPLFLAIFLYLGVPLPYLWVELVQALLSALLIWLVPITMLYLTRSRQSALIAALLIAVYPPLIYFPKQISPAIFATFFTTLVFLGYLVLLAKPTLAYAFVTGIMWGVAVQVEPVLLLGIPVVVGACWLLSDNLRQTFSSTWRPILLSVLVCLILVFPWTIRNVHTFGRFVPIKTSFGLNFWMGNNPFATGYQYTEDGRPITATLDPQTLELLSSMDEASRYEYLRGKAMEWILSHPAQFIGLTLRRVYYLWVISPTFQVTEQNIVESPLLYQIRGWLQFPVLLLAGLGAILAQRNQERRLLIINLCWVVVFTIPYMISIAGNTRFRIPAEPAIVMLGAYGISHSVMRLTSRWSRMRLRCGGSARD
jgi:hypothetical protein